MTERIDTESRRTVYGILFKPSREKDPALREAFRAIQRLIEDEDIRTVVMRKYSVRYESLARRRPGHGCGSSKYIPE